PRITRISRMFFLRSDSESSADLQSAVSQDFILQTDRTCPTAQVSSIGLQIKNLRYSRIQFCATPSGILNTIRFRIGYDYEASTVTATQMPPRRRFAFLPPPSRGLRPRSRGIVCPRNESDTSSVWRRRWREVARAKVPF